MKKKNRCFSFFIAGALLIGSASFAFAEAKADLIKEYEYEAENVRDLSYDAPEELKEEGKTYRLLSVEYEVIKDNEIKVMKHVETSDRDDFDREIKHELPSGKTVTLKAEDDISWKEKTVDAVTVTQEYKSRSDVPQQITSQKESEDGEMVDITLALSGIEDYSRKKAFSAPATFYTPVRGGSMYRFNGKVVTITGGSPVWSGYQADVKEYLGLNGNEYAVTGGSWSDGYTLSGGQYVRHATFTGTKSVPLYRATFTETDDTAKVYTAEIAYAGLDGKAKIKAIASYEKVLGVREYIMIGAGILVLALLIAAAIYLIGRRRKREGSE